MFMAFVVWVALMLWLLSTESPAAGAQRERAPLTAVEYFEPAMLEQGFTLCTLPTEEEWRVAEGIRWLVTPDPDREKKYLRVYADYRVHDDEGYRLELARAFLGAGAEFGFDPWLLVGMAYRESIFRMEEIGDGGKARGMMQVHGQGRKACASHCGDLGTVRQHVDCGACWLDRGRRWCGDLDGALYGYISGRCSTVEQDRRKAHRVRRRLAAMLDERFGPL